MKRYIQSFVILFFIPVIVLAQADFSKNFQFGIDIAPSLTIGKGVEDFNSGFAISGEIIYQLRQFPVLNNRAYLMFGGRYSYNHWSPMIQDFKNVIENIPVDLKIEGAVWSMEIVPVVKFVSNFENHIVNIFVQGGAGMYIVHTKTHLTGTVAGQPISRVFGSETGTYFGMSFGGGFIIGSNTPVTCRIYPLYNKVIRGESPNQYWNIYLGLVFKI